MENSFTWGYFSQSWIIFHRCNDLFHVFQDQFSTWWEQERNCREHTRYLPTLQRQRHVQKIEDAYNYQLDIQNYWWLFLDWISGVFWLGLVDSELLMAVFGLDFWSVSIKISWFWILRFLCWNPCLFFNPFEA